VYEDIYDAKEAADHLSGFNVANRYLIVLFYGEEAALRGVVAPALLSEPYTAAPKKAAAKADAKAQEAELRELQKRHGVSVPDS
jgi:pre-mRNA branch site protein p14